MATSPTEFFILRIPPSPIQPLTYTDGPPLVVPAQSDKASASSTLPGAKAGMGAFSGLGGYVGKGFGALGGGRTGPAVIGTSLSQGELLVMRESASRYSFARTVHLLTVRLPPRHAKQQTTECSSTERATSPGRQ
jgi:hypothetical protein